MLRRAMVGLAVLCMAGTSALAGGFEYTENGARVLGRSGAWVAKADDPIAIHYNPAGLKNWKGHKILVNAGLTYMDASLTMLGMDDVVGPGKLFESATTENSSPPFFAPALAWGMSEDFWAVGLAVYGPGAYGKRDYGKNGPQQFMLSHADMLLAYISGTAAFEIIPELSIGVTLQLVTMPYAKFGLTIDGGAFSSSSSYGSCPDGQPCSPNSYHAQAELDVSDWARFAAIIGMHIRPHPNVEIGISSRVTPIEIVGTGPMDLKFLSPAAGLFIPQPGNTFASAAFVDAACGSAADPDVFDETQPGCRENKDVSLSLKLPPWLRVGARYVHKDDKERELFDIELDVVVEFWSVLQQYDIGFEGKLKFFNSLVALDEFALPKKFKDSVAIRLGSDVNLVPDLFTLHLGAFWESETSPPEYSNIDFLSFMRAGASIGFTLKPIPELEITLAYQFIGQPGRTVTPEQAGIPMQRPLTEPLPPDGWDEATQGKYPGLPANAAVWDDSFYHTAQLGFVIHLGGGGDDEVDPGAPDEGIERKEPPRPTVPSATPKPATEGSSAAKPADEAPTPSEPKAEPKPER